MVRIAPPSFDVVDGVSTWWVDSARPGLRASLVFRRGMVDETLPTCGWTHLLEHLALHGSYPADVAVNGSVSLLLTSFDIACAPAEFPAVIARITARLRAIEPREITHEARVLQAESSLRGAGVINQALLWRYGASGPGLAGYSEDGLTRVSAQDLAELSQGWFTAGNAALILDGPIPAGLRLDLPEGPLRAVPQPVPCDQPVPGIYAHELSSVVATGVITRSADAVAMARILARRVTNTLRHAEGVAYSPWGGYEPLGPELAVVNAGTDANPDSVGRAKRAIVAELEGIVAGRDLADDVAEDIRAQSMGYLDPYGAPGFAWSAARDFLLGRPIQSPEELLVGAESVTADAVCASAEEFRASLLVGVPVGSPLTTAGDLPWLREPKDSEPPNVRRYRPRLGALAGQSLLVGADTLHATRPTGATTVPLSQVAACRAFPDGARTLIRQDGYVVHIEPQLWRRGRAIVSAIDAGVPAERTIPMRERESQYIPARPTRGAALKALVRMLSGEAWSLVGFALFMAIAGIAAYQSSSKSGQPFPWASFLRPIVLYAAVALYLNRKKQKQRKD